MVFDTQSHSSRRGHSAGKGPPPAASAAHGHSFLPSPSKGPRQLQCRKPAGMSLTPPPYASDAPQQDPSYHSVRRGKHFQDDDTESFIDKEGAIPYQPDADKAEEEPLPNQAAERLSVHGFHSRPNGTISSTYIELLFLKYETVRPLNNFDLHAELYRLAKESEARARSTLPPSRSPALGDSTLDTASTLYRLSADTTPRTGSTLETPEHMPPRSPVLLPSEMAQKSSSPSREHRNKPSVDTFDIRDQRDSSAFSRSSTSGRPLSRAWTATTSSKSNSGQDAFFQNVDASLSPTWLPPRSGDVRKAEKAQFQPGRILTLPVRTESTQAQAYQGRPADGVLTTPARMTDEPMPMILVQSEAQTVRDDLRPLNSTSETPRTRALHLAEVSHPEPVQAHPEPSNIKRLPPLPSSGPTAHGKAPESSRPDSTPSNASTHSLASKESSIHSSTHRRGLLYRIGHSIMHPHHHHHHHHDEHHHRASAAAQMVSAVQTEEQRQQAAAARKMYALSHLVGFALSPTSCKCRSAVQEIGKDGRPAVIQHLRRRHSVSCTLKLIQEPSQARTLAPPAVGQLRPGSTAGSVRTGHSVRASQGAPVSQYNKSRAHLPRHLYDERSSMTGSDDSLVSGTGSQASDSPSKSTRSSRRHGHHDDHGDHHHHHHHGFLSRASHFLHLDHLHLPHRHFHMPHFSHHHHHHDDDSHRGHGRGHHKDDGKHREDKHHYKDDGHHKKDGKQCGKHHCDHYDHDSHHGHGHGHGHQKGDGKHHHVDHHHKKDGKHRNKHHCDCCDHDSHHGHGHGHHKDDEKHHHDDHRHKKDGNHCDKHRCDHCDHDSHHGHGHGHHKDDEKHHDKHHCHNHHKHRHDKHHDDHHHRHHHGFFSRASHFLHLDHVHLPHPHFHLPHFHHHHHHHKDKDHHHHHHHHRDSHKDTDKVSTSTSASNSVQTLPYAYDHPQMDEGYYAHYYYRSGGHASASAVAKSPQRRRSLHDAPRGAGAGAGARDWLVQHRQGGGAVGQQQQQQQQQQK
ncbi:hypothetical protein OC842_000473 [Tilletia horrida]|uniref:Uncharacterized protein n=1 Tax=Tilletia horrida TaxID=155126 RepID=A0AAN6GJS0_9BASI|nr:hypothetical protein OC842_000473 [Tilletia horrida]